MSNLAPSISVVIPTYRREEVLLQTLTALSQLEHPPGEILVMDQTPTHPPQVEQELKRQEAEGHIRHIRLPAPSIPVAMNLGVREAKGDLVLFLDDDIIPSPDLVANHCRAHAAHPEAWAVVGQIIQPTPHRPTRPRRPTHLTQDLDVNFASDQPRWLTNIMAGNCSVLRARFLELGGFDENFIPPVSFRFETEFAKRLIAAGGRIWFEPRASIQHLRVSRGGTRATGSHLSSPSPYHSVGAYYYFLRQGCGWDRIWQIARRPFREVRTKYHLAHPWHIPVKFIGEIRAIILALRLYRRGPRLLTQQPDDPRRSPVAP